MAGDPFRDLSERLFGPRPDASAPSKEEKGVGWRAKTIDGEYYVPLSQVADLLEMNGVLPKVKAGIRRRVEEKKHG